MNIAVLLSGGVDSSVVVHLLCEQGYRPSLFYIKIGRDDADYMDCSAEEDMEMASAIARRYGLSLEVVDLHREYWDQVAAYAIDKIRRGLTPNPDVMCNKLIKFGCFEQRVGKDFDITATGHYATTVLRDGKTWLGTAADSVKDQTDFLAQIDYLQVSKLMFPLGRLMKNEVRDIALRADCPAPDVVTVRASAFWERLIIMILCAVSLAKGKGILWSWKRVESWASIGAIGFIPSASVKDWGWVEDRGLLSARMWRRM